MQEKFKDKINHFLDRMEETISPYAVPNLMRHIVIGMAIVLVCDLIFPGVNFSLYRNLSFIRSGIFRGEIWRLVSFIFLPPNTSLFFIIFAFYFYYLIGENLENYWGYTRFNLYYLLGFLGAVVSGFITGYSTNYYLNLSLFLAFTVLNPNYTILLFFILPVEIKWLGLIAAIQLLVKIFLVSWPEKMALVFSLINFFLFFGGDLSNRLRQWQRKRDWERRSNRDDWR